MTYSADTEEYIAFLYQDDQAIPMGATKPDASMAKVAGDAMAWCHEALDWDGRRHAVICYHQSDLTMAIDGYVSVGTEKPQTKLVRVQVIHGDDVDE